MAKRRACIIGVTGQDGTYLADLLRSKDYEVYGVDAPGRPPRSLVADFTELDIRDGERLAAHLARIRPDECYHLAALHHSSAARRDLGREGDDDRASIETNLLPAQTILQTLRISRPACRVFLAGSCHMFGDPAETPQTERTPFAPTTIYGITKTAATHLGRLYRAEKGMFVCTGILYNHESPLRGSDFASARIARAAADIARGASHRLVLGNPDATVDWGFAGDYVEAMHLMLQAETPEDFIIASGELHRVRDFAEIAFARVGLDWTAHVREDPDAYRPVSRTAYQGDISAIRHRLGWAPKTSFRELVEMMVDHALQDRAEPLARV